MTWDDVLGVLAIWTEHPETAAEPPTLKVVQEAYLSAERLMAEGLPAPRRIETLPGEIRLVWSHGNRILAPVG